MVPYVIFLTVLKHKIPYFCRYLGSMLSSYIRFSEKQCYCQMFYFAMFVFCVGIFVFVLVCDSTHCQFTQLCFNRLGCQLAENTAYYSHGSQQMNWVRDDRFSQPKKPRHLSKTDATRHAIKGIFSNVNLSFCLN